ncbi:MAG: ATP:cob(I)alamin adenosyltransferase [Flavobacteriales bacterium CG_4_9_14_3_um_filter_40_17]|nr:MAG: ATP:cob(I)alamin adenosyltransferase [Flavobacteriales bacterium CG_4_9_14_3_um_filter_40_17]
MKIYTKTGDTGDTSLFNGKRVAKHHLRVESYGNVDELNSFVGLLRDQIESKPLRSVLLNIQHQLFVIGSNLAFEPDESKKTQKLAAKIPVLDYLEIKKLENEIDRMDSELPAMTHFILPGGHPTISSCHLARSVCRRAERGICKLFETASGDANIIRYLNRLSDYLFVLARYLGKELGVEETKWAPNASDI